MDIDEKTMKRINQYLDKYTIDHNCTRDEAKKHMMVRIVSQYFADDEAEKATRTFQEQECGCDGLEEDRSC